MFQRLQPSGKLEGIRSARFVGVKVIRVIHRIKRQSGNWRTAGGIGKLDVHPTIAIDSGRGNNVVSTAKGVRREIGKRSNGSGRGARGGAADAGGGCPHTISPEV